MLTQKPPMPAKQLATASHAFTPTFPGADNITRQELSNGVVVLSRPNFNNPSVVISGYLWAGSLYDPDEKLGLANFTAAGLMRGTTRLTFQEIYDTLESAGASLGLAGGAHTTSFNGQCLAEDLDMLLALLAEILRQPSFPTEQVERLRTHIQTRQAIRAQDTAYMAQWSFEQIVYANHPYRHPADGFPHTIQVITPVDLEAFHHQFFGPRGLVLIVVGAVDPALAIEKVELTLGDWRNPHQPLPPELPAVTPLADVVTRRAEIPGMSQADLVMGVAGPPRCSPHFIAANLGNSILGQFGMMGRIGEVVREKAGLAYSAYSSLGGGLGPAPWDISAGANPADIEQIIDLIRQEIRRFVNEPVSDQELGDVKDQFTNSLPLSFESNHGVASALINLERHQLGLDYYRQYANMIQNVTREDVLAAARHYLDPDRLGIGIAGTFD